MEVQLGSFLSEVNEKTTTNNQYPVLTSSKSGLYLQSEYFNKQVASKDNTGYKIIKRNQFTYRAMSDTGEFFPNILDCADVGIVSPAYPVFEISDKSVIIPEYLKCFFKSNSFQHSISYFAQGSTRTSVKFNKMRTIIINIPSIEKQKETVEIIKKISAIITHRRTQLEKLDLLVKARFVEMFGEPLLGTQKWEFQCVGDVADAIDPQPSHRTPPIDENGIPYISIKDCNYKIGTIDFDNARKVGKNVLEEHLNRYEIHDGDFIIGKIGTIGNPIFIPARKDYTLSANIVLVQPNTKIVSPYFLKYSFMSDYVERQFSKAKNSTSQAAFGIQKVRSISIMNPDYDVQMEFENFVKQVDKSKATVQKALDEAQLLFDSLMQEYFG